MIIEALTTKTLGIGVLVFSVTLLPNAGLADTESPHYMIQNTGQSASLKAATSASSLKAGYQSLVRRGNIRSHANTRIVDRPSTASKDVVWVRRGVNRSESAANTQAETNPGLLRRGARGKPDGARLLAKTL